MTPNPPDLSCDHFFKGALEVSQPRRGYRFSIDAVLLADAAARRPAKHALDLGTGCGIIPLILAYRNPRLKVLGVEIQSDLAAVAERNVQANGLGDRIRIECRDIRTLSVGDLPPGLEMVVSNPPYRRSRSGRTNPDRQRAIARHEIMLTLTDLAGLAGRLLSPGGRFFTVYPAERLAELLTELRVRGVEPKWIQCIHTTERSEAKLILVEAVRGANPGLRIAPALDIYTRNGEFTEPVAAMLRA